MLVGGRSCEVCMALSQDAARSLAVGADTQPKDNRHLYLVGPLGVSKPDPDLCQAVAAVGERLAPEPGLRMSP